MAAGPRVRLEVATTLQQATRALAGVRARPRAYALGQAADTACAENVVKPQLERLSGRRMFADVRTCEELCTRPPKPALRLRR